MKALIRLVVNKTIKLNYGVFVMKHILIFPFLILFLSSCSSMNSPRSMYSVEAEDLLYITNKAKENMIDCIDDPRLKPCNEAGRLLKKYPWLITRRVDVTNFNGMRQDEWDTQIRVIDENLTIIDEKYSLYYQVKGNL